MEASPSLLRFATSCGLAGPDVRENIFSVSLGHFIVGDYPPGKGRPPPHVLVIDTSLSMATPVVGSFVPGRVGGDVAVSRLSVVKHGLYDLLDNAPATQPMSLVTFDDIVTVPCPTDNRLGPVHLDGDDASIRRLREFGVAHAIPSFSTRTFMKRAIGKLKGDGLSALGPAVTVGIEGAKRAGKPSIVSVFTDGEANRGCGSKEDLASWATMVGEDARDHGVVVNVFTFEGTQCNLYSLGRLAHLTGGVVKVATVEEITSGIFYKASTAIILATDCTVSIVPVDPNTVLRIFQTNTAEQVPFFPHPKGATIFVGNVTPSTELLLRYEIDRCRLGPAGVAQIDLMVIIEYTSVRHGTRITHRRRVWQKFQDHPPPANHVIHPEIVIAAAMREAAAIVVSEGKDKRRRALHVIVQAGLSVGCVTAVAPRDPLVESAVEAIRALSIQLNTDQTPFDDDVGDCPDTMAQSLYQSLSYGSVSIADRQRQQQERHKGKRTVAPGAEGGPPCKDAKAEETMSTEEDNDDE